MQKQCYLWFIRSRLFHHEPPLHVTSITLPLSPPELTLRRLHVLWNVARIPRENIQ